MGTRSTGDVWAWLRARLGALSSRLSSTGRWLAAHRAVCIDPNATLLYPGRERQAHLDRYRSAALRALGCVALDVGCGTGYGSRLLRDGGAALVVGIDSNREAIGYARKRYGAPMVVFAPADACHLPLRDASIDLVTCFETMGAWPPLMAAAALGECHRVLRASGTLLLSVPKDDARSFTQDSDSPRADLIAVLQEYFEVDGLYPQDEDDPSSVVRLLAATGEGPNHAGTTRSCIVVAHPRRRGPRLV